MNAALTGSRAVLEQLAADGVSYIFGNPGTVEQGFLDALTSFPEITYIETLQESVAVAIADAYARSTKRVAVIQLHSSPGLGNGIGMLYQARRGESPLLVLAGEAGTQFDAMDAQMAADLVAMAEPVTKFSTRVIHPASLLRTVRKAIKIASSHPMGPTFVALPMDVLDADSTEEVHPTSLPDFRSVAHPEAVEVIARALATARNPIFIVGDGVAAAGAQQELRILAESVGAAVWEANGSEVNMPFSHPAYMGALGHMFGHVSRAVVDKSDVVLICGTYVFPEVFPALEGVFAPNARVFHIDMNAYEIAKNFPVEIGLVCDPRGTLAAIAGSVDSVASDTDRAAAADRLAALTEQRATSRAKAPSPSTTNAGEPVTADHFVAALADALPDDALIFDEALTMSDAVKRHLGSDTPGTYFQTRGGSLGVGIPGAIGLKLANPDRAVVGFTGDGGSMYTIQALWTAVHHDVDAKFVVCNNRAYKLLKLNIGQYWQERGIEGRPYPASFDIQEPFIDFVALAQSMGVNAVRVASSEDVEPAISAMMSTPGPFLVDLVIP